MAPRLTLLLASCASSPGPGLGLPPAPPPVPPPCEVRETRVLGSAWSAATWTPRGWAVGDDGRVSILDDHLQEVEGYDVAGDVQDVAWSSAGLYAATPLGLWHWPDRGGALGPVERVLEGPIAAVAAGARVVAADRRGAILVDGVGVATPGRPARATEDLVVAGLGGVRQLDGAALPAWERWAFRPARGEGDGLVDQEVVDAASWRGGVAFAAGRLLVWCVEDECREHAFDGRITDLDRSGDTLWASTEKSLWRWRGPTPEAVADLPASRLAAHGEVVLLVAPDKLTRWDPRGATSIRQDRGPVVDVVGEPGLAWLTEDELGLPDRALSLEGDALAGGDAAWFVGGQDGVWQVPLAGEPTLITSEPALDLDARGDTLWLLGKIEGWARLTWAGGAWSPPERLARTTPAAQLVATRSGPLALDDRGGRLLAPARVIAHVRSPAGALRRTGDRVAVPEPDVGFEWWDGETLVPVDFWPGATDVLDGPGGWLAARGPWGLRDERGRSCAVPGTARWLVEAGPDEVWVVGPSRAHRVARDPGGG